MATLVYAQVLPDWRHQPVVDASLTEAERADIVAEAALTFEEATRKQLLKEVDDTRKAKAKEKQDDPAAERLANQHFVVALDNAIARGLGLEGLRHFMPRLRCEPLAANERRYLVAHKTGSQQVAKERCCVENKDTKERRFEVIVVEKLGQRYSPALHMKADQGPIGWPAFQWLRHRVGLRMTLCFDPHHRLMRDIAGAVSRANLHGVKIDFGLVLNVALGPWSGDAHFGTIQGGAAQMRQEVDHNWMVFQALYPEVCAEMGIKKSAMGSAEHMAFVWARVLECPLFAKTGMGVKFGRWFQWEDKSCQVFGHRTSFLLLLLFIGTKKGWWKTLMASPLFQADLEDADDVGEDGGVAGVGVEAPRQTVATSNESLRKRRGSCKNGLHLACKILSDRVVRRVHRGMVRLLGPARKFHGESLVKGKTRAGAFHLKIDMWKGAWHEVTGETLRLFMSSQFLEEVEFLDPEGGPYDEAELLEDNMVLKALYAFLLEVVGGTELTNMHYMKVPPFAFVGLLSDEASQAQCLSSLCDMWTTLVGFEEEMTRTPALKEVHMNMIFPRDQWFRELMRSLHEVGFKETPVFVEAAVHDFALSWEGTKITEDAHNVLRDKNRHSKSKSMSSKERWHKVMASLLLRDNDRPEVPITGAAKQVSAKKVPKSTFVWSGTEKFSLGLDCLQTLGESNPTWPALSPNAYRESPMVWSAVSGAKANYSMVSCSWMALLLEPGQCVKIGEKRGLVLVATDWGVLLMKVMARRLGSIGYVELALDEKNRPVIEPITFNDVGAVKVLEVAPMSPASFAAETKQACHTAVLRCSGSPQPVLQSAARRAFKNLTSARLEMLANMLHLEFPPPAKRPKTLYGWLEALVRFALPDIPAAQLDNIVSSRAKPPKGASDIEDRCQLLKASNLEVARNDLHGTEVIEDTKRLEEKRAKRRAREEKKPPRDPELNEPRPQGASASSSSSAVAPSGARLVMIPFESREVWTARDASAFAPPGTVVSRQMTPHVRWQGHYKNKPAPNYTTKSFSQHAGMSEQAALLCVLMQLWRWHKEVEGVDCPYGLEGAVCQS